MTWVWVSIMIRFSRKHKSDTLTQSSFIKEKINMNLLKNKWIWAGIVVVAAIVLWQSGLVGPTPAEVPAG